MHDTNKKILLIAIFLTTIKPTYTRIYAHIRTMFQILRKYLFYCNPSVPNVYWFYVRRIGVSPITDLYERIPGNSIGET